MATVPAPLNKRRSRLRRIGSGRRRPQLLRSLTDRIRFNDRSGYSGWLGGLPASEKVAPGTPTGQGRVRDLRSSNQRFGTSWQCVAELPRTQRAKPHSGVNRQNPTPRAPTEERFCRSVGGCRTQRRPACCQGVATPGLAIAQSACMLPIGTHSTVAGATILSAGEVSSRQCPGHCQAVRTMAGATLQRFHPGWNRSSVPVVSPQCRC